MNRRVWSCVGLLSVLAWCGRPVMAQTPPVPAPGVPVPVPASAAAGAIIPLGAQQAADATQYQPQIHNFVTEQFGLLVGLPGKPVDINARKAAREKLVAACPRGVSPSYGSIFGKELNAAAEKAIDNAKAMELRLNVAIVLSGVSGNAGPIELEPQVRRLLDDRDASVAYWAMKASGPLVGVLIQSPKFADNKLVPAIIACVKKHSGTDTVAGLIAEDAFHALAPQDVQNLSEADLSKDSLMLIGPVLDLLELRTSLFSTELVPTPTAERPAAAFLSKNFSAMTPPQQKRAIQDLVNYITYLAARTPNYDADQKAAPKTDASKHDEMTNLHNSLRTVAGALLVICPDEKIANGSVGWFAGVSQVGATVDEVVAHGLKVFPEVQAIEAYKFVTTPKPLGPMALPAPKAVAPAATPAPAATSAGNADTRA